MKSWKFVCDNNSDTKSWIETLRSTIAEFQATPMPDSEELKTPIIDVQTPMPQVILTPCFLPLNGQLDFDIESLREENKKLKIENEMLLAKFKSAELRSFETEEKLEALQRQVMALTEQLVESEEKFLQIQDELAALKSSSPRTKRHHHH